MTNSLNQLKLPLITLTLIKKQTSMKILRVLLGECYRRSVKGGVLIDERFTLKNLKVKPRKILSYYIQLEQFHISSAKFSNFLSHTSLILVKFGAVTELDKISLGTQFKAVHEIFF